MVCLFSPLMIERRFDFQFEGKTRIQATENILFKDIWNFVLFLGDSMQMVCPKIHV